MLVTITVEPKHIAEESHLVREASSRGDTLNLYLRSAEEAQVFVATGTTDDGIYFQDMGLAKNILSGLISDFSINHEIGIGDAFEGSTYAWSIEIYADGESAEERLAFDPIDNDADVDPAIPEPLTPARADAAAENVHRLLKDLANF